MTALFRMPMKVNLITSMPGITYVRFCHTILVSLTKYLGLRLETFVAAHLSGDATSKF